jgi:hypothetical protein
MASSLSFLAMPRSEIRSLGRAASAENFHHFFDRIFSGSGQLTGERHCGDRLTVVVAKKDRAMLPQSFASDRHDDRPPSRSFVSVTVAVAIAAFFIAMIAWQPRAQSSICDGKTTRAARLIGDVLDLMPIGHDVRAVISGVLVTIGLASLSCSGSPSHG